MQEEQELADHRYIAIAQMGSIEFQRKLCINGTKDEYLLLDEFIDSAAYRLKHWAMDPFLSRRLSDREKSLLLELHDHIDRYFRDIPWKDPSISIEDIVENNDGMKQIRKAANDCLHKLGVQYSPEEILGC